MGKEESRNRRKGGWGGQPTQSHKGESNGRKSKTRNFPKQVGERNGNDVGVLGQPKKGEDP